VFNSKLEVESSSQVGKVTGTEAEAEEREERAETAESVVTVEIKIETEIRNEED